MEYRMGECCIPILVNSMFGKLTKVMRNQEEQSGLLMHTQKA